MIDRIKYPYKCRHRISFPDFIKPARNVHLWVKENIPEDDYTWEHSSSAFIIIIHFKNAADYVAFKLRFVL